MGRTTPSRRKGKAVRNGGSNNASPEASNGGGGVSTRASSRKSSRKAAKNPSIYGNIKPTTKRQAQGLMPFKSIRKSKANKTNNNNGNNNDNTHGKIVKQKGAQDEDFYGFVQGKVTALSTKGKYKAVKKDAPVKKRSSSAKRQLKARQNTQFKAPKQNNAVRNFQLVMPSISANQPTVPWLSQKKQKESTPPNLKGASLAAAKETSKPTKYHVFPSSETIPVCPKSMDYFNRELMDFSRYVQLTDQEIEARDTVVAHIERFCCAMWNPASPTEPIECRVFGSYATRQVCTFESDVDMAIHGIVPPDEQEDAIQQRTTAVQEVCVVNEHAKISPHSTLQKTRKQDKISKWKAALDQAIAAKEAQDDGSKKPAAVESTSADGDDDLAFVLDRVGEIEESNEKDADPSDDVKAVVGDTEASKKLKVAIEPSTLDTTTTSADAKEIIEINSGSDDDANQKDVISISSSTDSADQLNGLKQNDQMAKAESFEAIDAIVDKRLEALASRLPDADGAMTDTANCTAAHLPDGDVKHDSDDEDREEPMEYGRRQKQRSISLCSSGGSASEDDFDDSDMQVSFVTNPNAFGGRKNKNNDPVVGPTGETRVQVVRVLNKLGKKLWKLPMTTNVHVRKHARVPIVNVTTSLGYECDIAVGGHNGTDTSAYASVQVSRFQSFAPVVLVLKSLLSQHDIDKPFTGGLGSFRLYVLVAHHLERHLSQGGADRPGDVLLTFLFRYCNHDRFGDLPEFSRSPISQIKKFRTVDGGSADLSGCFKLENCITVFGACFDKLYQLLKPGRSYSNGKSILTYIIDNQLLQERRDCAKRASRLTADMVSCDHLFQDIGPQQHSPQRSGWSADGPSIFMKFQQNRQASPQSTKGKAKGSTKKKKRKSRDNR